MPTRAVIRAHCLSTGSICDLLSRSCKRQQIILQQVSFGQFHASCIPCFEDGIRTRLVLHSNADENKAFSHNVIHKPSDLITFLSPQNLSWLTSLGILNASLTFAILISLKQFLLLFFKVRLPQLQHENHR